MLQYRIMKKKLKVFTKKIASGLKTEYQETKEIPKHLKNRNFKEATQQIADIGKMAFIALIWILPAGAFISGFIVKFSSKIRPSAFQDTNSENT
jgi:hypothetical protein